MRCSRHRLMKTYAVKKLAIALVAMFLIVIGVGPVMAQKASDKPVVKTRSGGRCARVSGRQVRARKERLRIYRRSPLGPEWQKRISVVQRYPRQCDLQVDTRRQGRGLSRSQWLYRSGHLACGFYPDERQGPKRSA